ncbi:conserved hypothetical protein [Talaromyces stipitatus ATCC 10500]|uniref:Endosomal/vacuolar adapter protein YPT35 n=1 Tax=Talaromyces stipitatus (strain ATCC 10500 / CBS 375.48 / QM 6759 / NRRL 1006) TaxID=441959 RepID=B8MF93_TALSN|nr:uncharacterized protein TSTA_012990 [Talaromyces stipitatus ATCC 10500]EED16192.1 conserved hypothetical protein [Talaromyces stipitatus ATCC 10500]
MEHTPDDETGSSERSAQPAPVEEANPDENNNADNDNSIRDVSEPTSDEIASTASISEHHPNNTNGTAHHNPDTNKPRKDRPVSGVVPPYWRHHRALSRASLASVDTHHSSSKPAITLEDHTADPDATTTKGLWARSVTIDDHVVVSGKTGIGAYVVWMCNVQTLDGGPMMIPMRYSEFDELRLLLSKAFPQSTNALPPLPPKSVLFKFRPKFLESRRIGLQYFLNCVLLNPEFAGSPVLKDFLFSRIN